jgi:hypothetical protein
LIYFVIKGDFIYRSRKIDFEFCLNITADAIFYHRRICMPSTVYFIDLRASYRENFVSKLGRLLEAAELPRVVKKRDLTAVKLHFGELGNTAFVRPVFLRKIVDCIKAAGGAPFLTDTNTLYVGTRSDSPHHIATALRNGFAYPVVDAPIIIADGLRGKSEAAVTINQKRFKKVYIGKEIVEANSFVSVAHFKGHELSGFGGAIKTPAWAALRARANWRSTRWWPPRLKQKNAWAAATVLCAAPRRPSPWSKPRPGSAPKSASAAASAS